MSRADLIENLHEAVAGARSAEKRASAITTESNEVEIAASIKASKRVAHKRRARALGKVKNRTLKKHKGAAPTFTLATYNG